MVKTAIFVEGQTELIFVREFLLRYFEYQNISIECYSLGADGNMDTVPYPFPASDQYEQFHFQIVNVGGDEAVLTNLLRRENTMWKSGFQRIVGLRDMYSHAYRKALKGRREIDPAINLRFIEEHQNVILENAQRPEDITFNFAIMETEAWFLGLPNVLEKENPDLSNQFIQDKLGFSLVDTDPETAFFHPASILEEILSLVKQPYEKRKGDIESLVSQLEKTDFEILLELEKCDSFNHFFESIRSAGFGESSTER